MAMVYRGAWPTPAEAFRLVASASAIHGALSFSSRALRAVCVGLYIFLLISLGLPTPLRSIGLDFHTFYNGAHSLFDMHESPYLAHGATAFPFPTFHLVYLLSLAGRLTPDSTFLCFVGLQAFLLGVCLILSYRLTNDEFPGHAHTRSSRLLQAGLLFQPAVLNGIGLGNSPVVAGVALMCAVWFWQRGASRWSTHSSAICINLAWMIKPQLLMATTFFLGCWWLKRRSNPLPRAARIGRLIIPWAIGLMAISLPMGFPGSALAYRDFPKIALTWHTRIAEAAMNNFAPSAIIANAMARLWNFEVAETLPILAAGIAIFVLLWNILSLTSDRVDTLRAFLPWLLASLLWSSLVWDMYLSLVLAGQLILVDLLSEDRGPRINFPRLLFCVGIGLTMVVSSFAYTLGILLLYFCCQELRSQEIRQG